jgi:hypothetical protein
MKDIEEFQNIGNPVNFNQEDFIDTSKAAKILGIKKGTLEVWRHQGKGPKFYKFGRSVRYYKPGLCVYFSRSCRSSTSDR